MNITSFLQNLIFVVVVATIPVLTVYATKFIQDKSKEIQTHLDDGQQIDLMAMITDLITDAVTQTNQTFVDSLKASGSWNDQTAKQAFNKTKTTILKLLTEDAKTILTASYGDLDAWLDTKIEATVKELKPSK